MGEYWIVDRFERTVTVLVRDGHEWTEHLSVEGQSTESAVLPGFVVPLADLWAAIPDEPNP